MEERKLEPKRRFEGFEEKWNYTNFSDLAEIVRGASPRPIEDSKWFNKKSDVGWLRISDVTKQNGRINYLEQRISKLGQEKTRVLKNSHLLLSIAATVGKPVINYVKTGVHDGFLIFFKPTFDIEYMYQWLEMFRPKWQQYGQPGSQVNLNSDIVKNHILMIPKLEEQQKIGEFFKVLDERIANQERKIAKVKALKEAYLTEMFPQEGESVPKRRFKGFEGEWKKVKLLEVTTYQNGIGHEKLVVNNGRYELINLNSISINGGLKPSGKYVNESNHILMKHDLVMILSDVGHGDLLGKVALIPQDDSYALNQRVALLRPNKSIDPVYLLYLINKEKKYFKNNGAGMSQLNISKSIVENYSVILPNLNEQKKIGEFFMNLDDQIRAEEAKLEKLKKMKEAYLEEMFV